MLKLVPLYLWRIFGRVKRSETRNIRSSVVSDSKLNLRSEREKQDSRIIQDGENLKSALDDAESSINLQKKASNQARLFVSISLPTASNNRLLFQTYERH